MKTSTRILLVAGIAGVSLATAAVAFSGGPGCDGFGPGHAGHGPGMMGHGLGKDGAHRTGFTPAEMATQRLDQLKTSLKLQPDQEQAWADFAAAVTTQAKRMGDIRDMRNTARTAPERIDLASKFAKEREQTFGEVRKAMKGLYEVLSPEQREVLDSQGPRHHG